MDDLSFVQWIIGQGGIAGIAVFAIWQMMKMNDQGIQRRQEDLNRELKRHDDAILRERENSDIHREDKRMLIDVVKANTESNARLVASIVSLDRHLVGAPREKP